MPHPLPASQTHPLPRVEAAGGWFLLETAQGGRVAVDRALYRLWMRRGEAGIEQRAGEIYPGATPGQVRAALDLLARAGLTEALVVERESGPAPEVREGPLVSVVVVSYNSLRWLPGCLDSLAAQTYAPLEIILVDNGSSDGSAAWMEERQPGASVARLPAAVSLAEAINAGVARAAGDYYLLLNPDVVLDPGAIAEMVRVAHSGPRVAAVAARLRLMWAPAFLNGLGNTAGSFRWGYDLGLGHLDLGQFDHWTDLPSACFAAALLTRPGWQAAGPLDSGFPLYYEDSEWCYRARLLGWSVLAAPRAVVYHAYGSRAPESRGPSISARKLHNVTYGKLRFGYKLVAGRRLWGWWAGCAVFDALAALRSLLQGDPGGLVGVLRGWRQFGRDRAAILSLREPLQARRAIQDAALFPTDPAGATPLVWRGMPKLTWPLVRDHYLPIIDRMKEPPSDGFQHESHP